ncbi:hypothetical protein GUJ93_ZPchr0008g11448 [Zizania palustris]|uniref:Uncharacterized protein n=1 Tax=Zizania palustris TaxID=103762 RepID=A0A8J5RJ56_ZIZPA|nr:hypothetical protein GUJ93_ZPchr0008g11448 [Zizania palustris]
MSMEQQPSCPYFHSQSQVSTTNLVRNIFHNIKRARIYRTRYRELQSEERDKQSRLQNIAERGSKADPHTWRVVPTAVAGLDAAAARIHWWERRSGGQGANPSGGEQIQRRERQA